MSDKKTKKTKGIKAGTPPKADRKSRRKGDTGTAGVAAISVAGHPRAQRSVREIKAWAGLAGFTVALLLSLQANVPVAMAGERALIGGVGAYIIAWGCALAVWRALVLAEVRARVDELTARREEAATTAASAKPVVR